MERERRSRRRVTEKDAAKTLPSSPSHHQNYSSSSSDFEFITISNNNSTSSPYHHNKPFSFSSSNLCPADELFYKGQLLPLHISPRFSMVQTLLLSSSSTSSSSNTGTTDSRDSNSSNDSNSSFSAADLYLLPQPDSARPSSVTEEDEFKKLKINQKYQNLNQIKKPTNKYLSMISSVFRKNRAPLVDQENSSHSVKKASNSAKEVISKYLKKVKPLYEKLSQKQSTRMSSTSSMAATMNSGVLNQRKELDRGLSQSFSDNSRYPRRKNCVSSCPSSMRSSPTRGGTRSFNNSSDSSSMEELQSAIQGAIAHCKNSMIQKKTL